MAFTKKTAATTSDAAGVASSAPKLNLSQELESLSVAFQSVVTESQAIPDDFLDASVQEAFKAVAALIGYSDYNPAQVASLYMLIKDDGGKSLYAPSLRAYGDGTAILWGQKLIPLDDAESFGSDKFSIMVGEYGAQVLVDPSGYCMPISVALESEYAKADSYKTFKTKLMTLRTAGAIAPYLKRGEPMLKWGDVEDGSPVEFHDVTPVMSKEDPNEVKYYRALAAYQGKPYSMYAPGEASQWAGVAIGDEPIVLTKKESTVTAADGTTYEIKGSFTKLPELEIGVEYKVVGFTAKDGKFGREVLMDIVSPKGEALKVNGNTYIVQRLGSAPSDEITPEKPATLILDSVNQTKSGNKRVACRLVTAGDNESPMIKQLRQRQAELASQKEAVSTGKIPF